jgi:hypothetical protein
VPGIEIPSPLRGFTGNRETSIDRFTLRVSLRFTRSYSLRPLQGRRPGGGWEVSATAHEERQGGGVLRLREGGREDGGRGGAGGAVGGGLVRPVRRCRSAPEGPQIVATGEAQRNPWEESIFRHGRPGGAEELAAPPDGPPSRGRTLRVCAEIEIPSPLRGFTGNRETSVDRLHSTGFAALHPQLQSTAPPGPTSWWWTAGIRNRTRRTPRGRRWWRHRWGVDQHHASHPGVTESASGRRGRPRRTRAS